ncbi:MAG: hypothetical protein K2K26_04220 [Muribaculaceae bacterium]|nr:hypothetical protein [Muribaculaceae bacterium]
MNLEEKIIDKYGRDTGMTVPEGYFDRLFDEVSAKLPPYPEVETPAPMSVWQRIKPYIYLAAMFVGIWLMMKVFHTATDAGSLYLDNPPESVVVAMTGTDIPSVVMMPTYESDTALEAEVSGNYSSIEDFEADFGYSLSPQYAAISIPDHLLK